MKVCSKCGEEKEETEFYNYPEARGGTPMPRCKACSLAYDKEYFKNNKDRISKVTKDRHEKDPRVRMLTAARFRAKQNDLPFDLTLNDIEIPTHCPILNIELRSVLGKGPKASSPSLDKLIPELGYVKGNVNVISHRANTLKGDATVAELESLAQWIRDNQITPV